MKRRIMVCLLVLATLLSVAPVLAGAAENTPSIQSVSVSLSGILGINIKVDLAGEDASLYTVEAAVEGRAVQVLEAHTVENKLHVYTADLLIEDLYKTVQITLKKGTETLEEKTFSYNEYKAKLLQLYPDNGALQTLIEGLGNYGSYAAHYADPSTPLTSVSAVEAVSKADVADYATKIYENDGSAHAMLSLLLDEACDLRIKIKAAALAEGSVLTVDGNIIDQSTLQDSDDYKMYEITEMLPQNWSRTYRITVKNGDATVLDMGCSVLSYVYANLRLTEETEPGLNGMLKAMHLYQLAANGYAVGNVEYQIITLPDVNVMTASDLDAVWAVYDAYMALPESDRAQIANAQKLLDCVAKANFWNTLAEKAVINAADTGLTTDMNGWATPCTAGVDNTTFGTVMAVPAGAATLAIESGKQNDAWKASENIVFYIYNPTASDVAGTLTNDNWQHTVHFLLKANSWNRIALADWGAAGTGRDYISANKTIYINMSFAGEGWLISSFYDDSAVDMAAAAVVIDAANTGLTTDMNGWATPCTAGVENATFGTVMAVPAGAATLAIEPGRQNDAWKASKNIVFYIYNPTGSDVAGTLTNDNWQHTVHFLLKANSWNRVELADWGTAGTGRDYISANKTIYINMSFAGEGWLISSFYSVEEMTVPADPEAEAIAALNEQLAALPEASALVGSNTEAVNAAKAAYDALSPAGQGKVENAAKLIACVDKVTLWSTLAEKAVINAANTGLTTDMNGWATPCTAGVDNTTFGTVMAVPAGAATLAIESGKQNDAWKASENIVFYIYNPTASDVAGTLTNDNWQHTVHFLLKANSWNRIALADWGAAGTGRDYISANKTIYINMSFTGEGWLISSFYDDSAMDVAAAAVVIDAANTGLTTDMNGWATPCTAGVENAAFGTVMAVPAGAATLAIEPGRQNDAWKASKNIVFYIYNPTGSDVAGTLTNDNWQHTVHFLLKANSWNRVELADWGAAGTGRDYISANKTIYINMSFSGEGWLISSFYTVPEL